MNDIFEKLSMFGRRSARAKNKFEHMLKNKEEINPGAEASRIAVMYGTAGMLWIMTSDWVVGKMITKPYLYRQVQMYKGWLYVFVTMMILYFLIKTSMEMFKKAIWDNEGEPVRIAGSHTDITEYKKMEEKLQYMAYYDELTGLSNRNMFGVEISNLIDRHKANGTKFAVVYMDVDNFKHVNDTLGHASGDMLLTYIADILKNQLDEGDMAVRLGGDEFSILIGSMNENEDVANKLDRLVKHLRRPWMLKEHEFFVSFSMGVAVYPDNGDDMTALLKSADTAMFSVKENGKDSYCFYTDSMQEKTLKHIDMINSLRRAIEDEEFVLYYQPIVNMKSGDIEGVEALVRWLHPKKGFISPLDFIPLAEETGQILEIGSWVMKTACKTKRKWENMGFADVKMSINFSGKRIVNTDVDRELETIIQSEGISVKDIQIEVTETAVMKNMKTAVEVLLKMRNRGIKIALDDFGTGYSSLTYLKNLPIDVVKIDRGFIKNIEEKKQDEFIVKTVVELAHGLGKEIVAEGIETKRQLEFLREIGCDTAQGYLFSRPVPAEEIENMLIKGKNYSELVTGVTE